MSVCDFDDWKYLSMKEQSCIIIMRKRGIDESSPCSHMSIYGCLQMLPMFIVTAVERYGCYRGISLGFVCSF